MTQIRVDRVALYVAALLSIVGCDRSSAPVEDASTAQGDVRATYVCVPGQAPLTATYANDASPPTVVLDYRGVRVTAALDRSASGARYTGTSDAGASVEFWEHQDEATLGWFGTEFRCQRQ